MPFIGNQPALSYTSFAKQDFTTSATTSYTLDHPVTNENEIALFINFVRQEPTTAYTASGTSLTLTSATSATDDMYCVFLGKAVQTVNPPNGSVGIAQLADSAKSIPAFSVGRVGNQSSANSTYTTILFDSERFDTDNAYDTSTGKFTVPSGKAGKYFFYAQYRWQVSGTLTGFNIEIHKNGSQIAHYSGGQNLSYPSASIYYSDDLSVGDYIEVKAFQSSGSSQNITGNVNYTNFSGFKLIG
jgi:hypothetical protein